MKLVYKILLLVVLPTTLLSLVFLFFINNILYEEVEKRFLESIENTTIDYSKLIQNQLNSISNSAYITSNKIKVNPDLSVSDIKHIINETVANDSMIFGASIFLDTTFMGNHSKTMIYASRNGDKINTISFNSESKQYVDYFKQNFSWWKYPKETLKPIWTSPYFDKGVSNNFMITYAKPFFINNEYSGIISIDILIKDIKKILLINEKRIEGSYDPDLYILNKSDSVIIFSEKNNRTGQQAISNNISNQKYDNTAKFKILDLINGTNEGTAIVKSSNGENYFVFYASIPGCDWYIIDILSVSKAQEAVYNTISHVVALLFIFVTILIILIFTTSRLITKPVSKLSAFSLQVSNGNYENTLDIKSKDEIGILANNFILMVNKLKEREASLKYANNQLLELDEAKNQFLNLISHEIRTPLNGIVGSTYFLKDMIKDPELNEFMEMLKESVDRLDAFSRTALGITEMQTVGNKLEKSEIDITPIIESLINNYNDSITAKKLSTKTNFKGNNKLSCIPDYFTKSMDALISNAIKFSNDSSTIEIDTYNSDNNLIIKISNTGEVIPHEKINDIIKPFGLGREHYDKNIGLGLTYVQKFLELHNGKMDISSSIEKTVVILIFDQSKND